MYSICKYILEISIIDLWLIRPRTHEKMLLFYPRSLLNRQNTGVLFRLVLINTFLKEGNAERTNLRSQRLIHE